ncbi:MAG: PEP-CTERM sorting domain-containing protein [Pyrinomonadaceae bacterium]
MLMRFLRICSLLVLLSFLSSPIVRAETITVSLGEASFTGLADTVSLFSSRVSLSLTPFVPLSADLQAGLFSVGNSGPVSDNFLFTLPRSVSIQGVGMTVAQPGQLVITPTLDTLFLFDGPTLTYDLGRTGLLDFTLRGVTLSAFFVGDQQPFTVGGTFLLRDAAPIPEPATVFLLGTGLAGLGATIRKRRQAQSK